MNFKAVGYTVGNIFKLVAVLLVIPIFTSFVLGELFSEPQLILAYLAPMIILLSVGYILSKESPENASFTHREGFLTVGASWILITVIGALPYLFWAVTSPHFADLSFIDYLFESASGFSTTGSTILSVTHFDKLPKGLFMWRSLSQWMGGMGILLFVLAVLPGSGASSMHIVQSETTGFSKGKLVSKTGINAKILYLIYVSLTVLQVIVLLFSGLSENGTDLYNAVIISLGTTSTGGFSATVGSLGDFNAFVQAVTAIFMLLSGINFALYFAVITGRFKDVFSSSELRLYISIILIVTIAISLNIWLEMGAAVQRFDSFWGALPYAAFTTVSVITSTSFDITASAGVDYQAWAAFSRVLIILLIFIGGCAGSTAGGFKVSRIIILVKTITSRCASMVNPNVVRPVRYDGKSISDKTISGVVSFFVLYILVIVTATVLLAIDPAFSASGQPVLAAFSTALSQLSNSGPAMVTAFGASGNYAALGGFSKILCSIVMLLGRLEIYPILLLAFPKTYKL